MIIFVMINEISSRITVHKFSENNIYEIKFVQSGFNLDNMRDISSTYQILLKMYEDLPDNSDDEYGQYDTKHDTNVITMRVNARDNPAPENLFYYFRQ